MSSPPSPVREFHYRIGAPARGHFPGHHRSRSGSSGFEFRGHANLMDAPDPRRLDLHASLRDPFGNWIVRVYSQRQSIPVVMVADVSASMAFVGRQRKLDVVADFAESLAWSAWRTGDSFGFIGCDEGVRPELLASPSRSRAAGSAIAERLRQLQASGRSAQGLQDAHRHLPRQRALVFLVSDFHLPAADIQALLGRFAHHELVPVVVWDPLEHALTATRGLAPLVDLETGRRRMVWWRPALREKWLAAHAAQRAALLQQFSAARLKPLIIDGGAFDADAVTRHFHA
jgi:uncharacterized protein (DUF58 family)